MSLAGSDAKSNEPGFNGAAGLGRFASELTPTEVGTMIGPPSCLRLRILVIDDYPDAADSLRVLLRLWGHEVQIAYTGQQALTLAQEFKPHVILLDIQMPFLHGGDVAQRLRQQPEFKSTLFVATTAAAQDDDRLAAFLPHFDHYLHKPFDLTKLERLLISHVQKLREQMGA